ncbi:hypothetical protein [Devosia sp.]|uniref:hypothetical protein n=1 Tax=Devosia sp. TaxID=1871048 RepID=UPI001ACF301E|nr:hypothetical protein [Devosia sp.]MBN9310594.1 hypothetical protein [Devosia sp.]
MSDVLAMRALLALLLVLVLTPALADDWRRYDNARFGYSIEVPPGFAVGREADNGDGREFRDGATKLAAWGGTIFEDSFEAAVAAAMASAEGDGWTLTYRSVTPSWASFSGMQGKRVLYQRMVAGCDGQYAAFRLQYSAADITRLDPVVNRLVRSLKPGC